MVAVIAVTHDNLLNGHPAIELTTHKIVITNCVHRLFIYFTEHIIGVLSQNITMIDIKYGSYLQYHATMSWHVVSIAQTNNLIVIFILSFFRSTQILDSKISDYNSDNKEIFYSLIHMFTFPTITLASSSKIIANAIGVADALPSLPLNSVLDVPDCPFNLIFVSKIACTLHRYIIFSIKSTTCMIKK